MNEILIEQVDEGERKRQDYGNLTSLRDSIATHGVIQPIILRREDNRLIAGGRRLRACQSLGKDTIPFVYKDECDELTLRELELEENLHRKDLTWQEEAAITAEIDRLKREKYGSRPVGRPTEETKEEETTQWSTVDTATSLNKSKSTVSRNLAVARALEVFPELAEVSDRATAMRLIDEHIEALEREISIREARERGDYVEQVSNLDSVSYILSLPDDSIDLWLTDPPYGSDIEQGVSNSRLNMHFDDSKENAIACFEQTVIAVGPKLKKNAHVYVFCSADIELAIKFHHLLAVHIGRTPDPKLLVWDKKRPLGLTDFSQKYAPRYEFIIFIPAEGRSLAERMDNVLEVPSLLPQERHNPAEKPVALLVKLIQQSTVEGEAVLDTFVGSGATAVATLTLKRRFYGCDIDPEQCKIANLRLGDLPTTLTVPLGNVEESL